MNKKIEVLIIEDDMTVVHRSVSTVYADSNPFNVAIQAMIEQLTGTKPMTKVQAGAVPLNRITKDKFAEAVPDYVPPPEQPAIDFHPDLVKQGVAPVKAVVENGIPTVKLDMKSVLKGAK